MPDHLPVLPCEVTDEERTTALKELEERVRATAEMLVQHHSALGADIRFVTSVEYLTQPVIVEYTRANGIPTPDKIHRHRGLNSYSLWAFWGDVRVLANGMLVLIETHKIKDVPTKFCLAVRLEALNEHQLTELADRLSGIASSCEYEAADGRHHRQRLRDRNNRT